MQVAKFYKTGNFEIAYVNIESLAKKVDKLEMELLKLAKFPHAIVVLETWLKPWNESKVQFKGYKAVFCSRLVKKHGGIAIFIHESVAFDNEKVVLKHVGINHIVVIKLLDLNINLMAFYRTYDGGTRRNVFWNELRSFLQNSEKTIICCDSNMNVLKRNPKYIKLITTNGFRICNGIADRFECYTNRSKKTGMEDKFTIIDQVMCNFDAHVHVENFVVEFSNHRLLYVTAKLQPNTHE